MRYVFSKQDFSYMLGFIAGFSGKVLVLPNHYFNFHPYIKKMMSVEQNAWYYWKSGFHAGVYKKYKLKRKNNNGRFY
jgi:hypothetical protein